MQQKDDVKKGVLNKQRAGDCGYVAFTQIREKRKGQRGSDANEENAENSRAGNVQNAWKGKRVQSRIEIYKGHSKAGDKIGIRGGGEKET